MPTTVLTIWGLYFDFLKNWLTDAIAVKWFGSSIVCFGDHMTFGLIDWLIGD